MTMDYEEPPPDDQHYHHEIWLQRDDDGHKRWHVINHEKQLETCHEDAAASLSSLQSNPRQFLGRSELGFPDAPLQLEIEDRVFPSLFSE